MFGEDDAVEFVNLYEEDTGVPGMILISTRMGSHGPRVKYFVKNGNDDRSFSASIAEEPRVVANSLVTRDLNRASPLVLRWVTINREALLRLWNEGRTWSVREVAAFAAGLKQV